MTSRTTPSIATDIVLRVPGRWRTPAVLSAALPERYEFRRGRLHGPEGLSVELIGLPADDEFPAIFAHACGRGPTRRARRAIEGYAVNACLVGPGGSVEAAGRLMRAATALLDAGGLGVFVDNGLIAHEPADWRRVAERIDPDAVFLALVNVLRGDDELWSLGLHVMGFRDVVVPRSDDDQADHAALFDAIEHACTPTARVEDGDEFRSGGTAFRFRAETANRCPPSNPAHNPYGVWRLERLG